MKVEDLIQLLNNRLREFKLSQNYATMSGDLERMNSASKEVIALEDTLFKLNLLIDASTSATVKETTVAKVITDGSVAVLGEYDISLYATDPLHEQKIMTLLSNMGIMDTTEQVDEYIKGRYRSSPVTGEMIMNAANAYTVDARLMMVIMELDSRFGTVGIAVSTINPGNVGNDDGGNTRTYDSWQDGVTAVAEWLSRHRGSTRMLQPPLDTILELTATSTSPVITTATSTPTTATSSPVTVISTTTTSTTTPATATSTPTTATSTPVTATSTPTTTSTTTPMTIPTTTTSTTTPTTSTTTPTTAPEPTPEPEPEPEPEPTPEPTQESVPTPA